MRLRADHTLKRLLEPFHCRRNMRRAFRPRLLLMRDRLRLTPLTLRIFQPFRKTQLRAVKKVLFLLDFSRSAIVFFAQCAWLHETAGLPQARFWRQTAGSQLSLANHNRSFENERLQNFRTSKTPPVCETGPRESSTSRGRTGSRRPRPDALQSALRRDPQAHNTAVKQSCE